MEAPKLIALSEKFESPSGTKIRKKPTLGLVFFRLPFGLTRATFGANLLTSPTPRIQAINWPGLR